MIGPVLLGGVLAFFIETLHHLMQKVSWLMAPMGELMSAHLNTLADYPPVQGGKSFDRSNVVQDYVRKAKQ